MNVEGRFTQGRCCQRVPNEFFSRAPDEKDEPDEVPESSKASSASTGLNLCAATLRHMRDPRQVMLIPLTVFSGLEQAFFSSDFTAVRWKVA